jgi:hypothetical protein
MSYGANAKFAIARQSNEGSYISAVASFTPLAFLSHDIGLEMQEMISENLSGRFEEGPSYAGPSNIAGTIEMELTPKSLQAGLTAVLNHAPVTVSSDSLRTYTFTPNTAEFSSTLVKAPYSIYFQLADASSAEHWYDAQLGQIEFSIGQGAFLKGRLGVVGGRRRATGIGSLDLNPNAADAAILFPWNVASISYGGVGLSNMSELTISVNENIEQIYSLNGTLTPYKYARAGFREVTVNGTFFMTDRTFLNNFANETQARLQVTLINSRTAVQSGYFHTLVLDVPQLRITQFKPSPSGPGEVSVPITGRGKLDTSSNYSFQAILTTTGTAL